MSEVLEPFVTSVGAHVLVFVLGTIFGSFANVCIFRWPPSEEHPRGRSVVVPGSHCGSCGQPVKWYDNIPMVSYLVLRGRCRACKVEFSPRYLLVEGLAGLLFVAAYHHVAILVHAGDPIEFRLFRFAILAAFLLVLVIIAFIDLDHQLILDKITYPAIPIFYALGLCLPENTWRTGLVGAVVGYGLIRLVADGYYFLTRRHGLGYGDGKLLAMVGALWGWQAVITALFVGSLVGSIVGVSAIVWARRRDRDSSSAGTDSAMTSEDMGTSDPDETLHEAGTAERPDEETAAPPPLRHVAVPFGPFLAVGAVFYIFTASWLHVVMARAFAGYPPV